MTEVIMDQGGEQRAGPLRNDMSPGLTAFMDQFLELLDSEVKRDEARMPSDLRSQVNEMQAALTRRLVPAEVAAIAASSIEFCRRYLELRRTSEADRESGLEGIINLLRETLTTVAADTGTFTASLTTASERFSELMEVTDIHVLKERLTQEVNQIRQEVKKKQERDKELQEKLAKRVETLEARLTETQVAAAIDPLTQVAHRGQFDQTLRRWLERTQEIRGTFVLVVIDVDHFKAINDTYGHQAGDRALLGVAQWLTAAVRPSDLVARYGGDEFALLVANMSLKQAERRMSEVVAKIAGAEFRYERAGEELCLRLTISCGLTEWDTRDTAERLIHRADEALYAAKLQGRNCTVAKRPSVWRVKLHLGARPQA